VPTSGIKSTCAFPYIKTSLQPLSRKIQGALWIHKSPCLKRSDISIYSGLQKLRVQNLSENYFYKELQKLLETFCTKLYAFPDEINMFGEILDLLILAFK
jgi:hypothetical protein